jgi:hypothetical protein
MRRRAPLDTQAVLTAAILALVTGLAGWMALSWVATPADLAPRLAQVERQTGQAEDLLSHNGHIRAYPIDAVCARAAGPAAARLKQDVQTAAAGAGVAVTRLEISAGVADEAMGGLSPINIGLEASGRYDQTVALLGALAKLRPQIFVDQSDLNSKVSAVSLKLYGHAYCSISAPL